jgi:hypothetical protein
MQRCDHREASDSALRNMNASRDAEAARLHGEIKRLRAACSGSSCGDTGAGAAALGADAGHDAAAGAAAADDGGDGNTAAREAVLEAAVAAKDKPTAVLHRLHRWVREGSCPARIM